MGCKAKRPASKGQGLERQVLIHGQHSLPMMKTRNETDENR
jgi:hypothetical protein